MKIHGKSLAVTKRLNSDPSNMAEPTLASLQAAIDVLNATLSDKITEIKETEQKSQEELNTFYLMWAGTPLS